MRIMRCFVSFRNRPLNLPKTRTLDDFSINPNEFPSGSDSESLTSSFAFKRAQSYYYPSASLIRALFWYGMCCPSTHTPQQATRKKTPTTPRSFLPLLETQDLLKHTGERSVQRAAAIRWLNSTSACNCTNTLVGLLWLALLFVFMCGCV